MTIEKKLLGTTPVSGEVLPEAVSFDGTNDYLSRSSDMTGNADGKTFTLSFWIYPSGAGVHRVISFGGNRLYFTVSANGEYAAGAQNSSGSNIFVMGATSGYPYVAFNTWNHVLLSINLANSSERHLYINDGNIPPQWQTYSNQNIDFTNSEMGVGAYTLGSAAYKTKAGRLAHVFLDYTYRNLSTTSNRRLFIDADGKPSSTIPSSPILYLPMTDAATAGSNSGTGGDFTVNGVLATAERGPNQDNCSASTFDGSADYLSSTGISDSTTGTIGVVSCIFTKGTTGAMHVFSSNNGTGNNTVTCNGTLIIQFGQTAGKAVEVRIPNIKINTLYHITVYVDTSVAEWDGSTDIRYLGRKVCINGVLQADSAVTWQTWTKDAIISTNSASNFYIGRYDASWNWWNGDIGEFYFNTPSAYIDLATDNPFWDSDTNRPNSVRKVIADTSVTPLVALPLMGNDAGNNLGSGGNFTVNSGPYTGARGGSEFWARSADFNGSTSILKNAVSGLSDSKTSTIFTVFKVNSAKSHILFAAQHNNGSTYANNFVASVSPQGNVVIRDDNNDYVRADDNSANTVVVGQWYALFMSFDLANSSKRYASLVRLSNGTVTNLTWTYYVNTAIDYSAVDYDLIGSSMDDGNALLDPADANIASLYFTTEYYDFTQEINRHNFLDQLSYPTDLTQLIEDGDIPNPTTYMKFDNTANLGTNSGTGGAYTNTSVVAGADVDP